MAAIRGSEDSALYPAAHGPRWEKAHAIAQMVGMPAKLCFQFLEVADGGAADMAAELVMTYGMRHVAGLEKDQVVGESRESGGRRGCTHAHFG